MPKFRKQPVAIDAVQFTGGPDSAGQVIAWMLGNGGTARWHDAAPAHDYLGDQTLEHLSIDTLEGTMRATVGDWIIRGVAGEFYPCKPDIFDATYANVEDEESLAREVVTHIDRVDEDGNPAGGSTSAPGLAIEWQNGPLVVDGVRRERTGAFVEDVVEAAIRRIEFYQRSRFHCVHNAAALGNLYAAREALAERTRDRERRGVEGSHQL